MPLHGTLKVKGERGLRKRTGMHVKKGDREETGALTREKRMRGNHRSRGLSPGESGGNHLDLPQEEVNFGVTLKNVDKERNGTNISWGRDAKLRGRRLEKKNISKKKLMGGDRSHFEEEN